MVVRGQEAAADRIVEDRPGRFVIRFGILPAMVIDAISQFTETPIPLADLLKENEDDDTAQKDEGDESSLRSEGEPTDV